MINLILCGGSGSLLWPISRNLLPKQFYPLLSSRSLFEETIIRNKDLVDSYALAVNVDQLFLAETQLDKNGLDSQLSLIEPCGRNTAPAIALICMKMDPEEILFVTPSNHLALEKEEYKAVIQRGKDLADSNNLVTFGLTPTYPEVHYGYIKFKDENVLSFEEKPNLEKAKSYLEDGSYLWNSGMFCFKAGVFLEELKKYSPRVYTACKKVAEKFKGKYITPDLAVMKSIPSISIDYAVLEKSPNVKVIHADIGLTDLGSFDALYEEVYDPDSENAIIATKEPIMINSKHNLILSEQKKVACIDVDDLLIVDTEDSLLVSKRGSSEKVKDIVKHLKADNSELLNSHMTVKRPWGNYTILQDDPKFKVKRIEVNQGSRLSLQYHMKRQEHWTVVEGMAKIQIDDEIKTYHRNNSVFIPIKSKHRLENIGPDPLVIIETQIGSYFGEDDIIRLEDDWGR